MSEPLREIEGTWEEVAAHDAELRGHHVKLTVLDGNGVKPKAALPIHANDPLDKLNFDLFPGLRRPLRGNGTGAEIMQRLRETPIPENEPGIGLWEVIAGERAIRRQMAQEAQD